MEVYMQITRDIVVKMIDHGCFDNLPITSDETLLQKNEHMAMQICKVYRIIYDNLLTLDSVGLIQKLYQGDNQL